MRVTLGLFFSSCYMGFSHFIKMVFATEIWSHIISYVKEVYPSSYLKDNQRLKITDFNVSKFIDAQKEFGQLKDVLEIEMWTYTGTIAYSAPERFMGGSYTYLVM